MKTILFKTNNKQSADYLADYIGYLNEVHKGKEVAHSIEIKKHRPVRSVSANSYYWIVLQAIAAVSGDTENDLHEIYKIKFNGKDVRGIRIGQSTADLDTADFSVYVKKVKEHGEAFFGVKILEPTDKYYSIWEQTTKERYNAMFSAI